MLRAMFSGRMEVLSDAEGFVVIDRSGKHFELILNFLRDGSVALPDNIKELKEILVEAKYYCVTELAGNFLVICLLYVLMASWTFACIFQESCERALLKKQQQVEAEPICRVPLITSQKEELYLISTSTKPVLKLLINRHNNKYSYTNTSDDNLLKNIELFDKLSLRFSTRILFIKGD